MSKKKKKQQAIEKTIEIEQPEITYSLAFWGLAVLLFLPPFVKGLYFQSDQEWALIIAAVVFWLAWLWKWSKRDYSFSAGPLDYFILALPVLYLIAAFNAVNYGYALDEIVKATLYFLVYWCASRLPRDEHDIAALLKVIYISALGVALAGLATATGIIHIKDGFLGGRIYSTFQYPNALASFLAAVLFIGIYLWIEAGLQDTEGGSEKEAARVSASLLSPHNIGRFLYASGNFLLLAVLIGTKSNGGILVFALVFILFMLGLPRGNAIKVFTHLVLLGVPSLAAGFMFTIAAKGSAGTAWLWFLAGLIVALAGQWLYESGERRGWLDWLNNHKTRLIAVLLVIVLIAGAGIAVFSNSDGGLLGKFTAAQFRLRNLTERTIFYRDALSMFSERPYLGWGGGGWQEAYRAYQSYLYNANHVHNHYLQVAVETGVPGIAVFAGIWVSFLIVLRRACRKLKEDRNRLLIWTIAAAAFSIGLHAAIDVDLSLAAISLLLFSLFGFTRNIEAGLGRYEKTVQGKSYIPPDFKQLAAPSVLSVLLVVLALCLATANYYTGAANSAIAAQDLARGGKQLQAALSYNPLRADCHNELAKIYQRQGKLEEGLAEANIAVAYGKYSSANQANVAKLSLVSGKLSDALSHAAAAVRLAPFQVDYYELLSQVSFTMGVNELSAGRADNARTNLNLAAGMPGIIEGKMLSLSEEEIKLWQDAPHMKATPEVLLKAGAAQYLLGNWQASEANLSDASIEAETKTEALFWLSILKSKQGKDSEARDLAEQVFAAQPKFKDLYDGMKQLPLLM
jgi:O-antigen ligase